MCLCVCAIICRHRHTFWWGQKRRTLSNFERRFFLLLCEGCFITFKHTPSEQGFDGTTLWSVCTVWILGGNVSLCMVVFLWMLKWSSVTVIWLQLEWFALAKFNWIHKCNLNTNLNTVCYNWFCADEQTAFKIDMENRYCLLGFHEIDSFICLFIFISWQHIWEMWKGGDVSGPGDGVFVLTTLYRHCCCRASPARNGDIKGCLMTVQMPVDLRVKCCREVQLCPCVMAVDRFSAQFFNLLRADEMGNTRFWVDTVWENSLGLWKLPRLSLILNFEMPCSVSNFRFWC